MIAIDILPPTRYHALELISSLRDGDRRELAAAKVSPAKAVWRGFRRSLYRRAVLVDGKTAAMWGVGGNALGRGEVWLLTSKEIEKIPFSFIRGARAEVQKMLSIFPSLIGAVHCEYHSAVKFVQLLGFNLTPGSPFILFSKER